MSLLASRQETDFYWLLEPSLDFIRFHPFVPFKLLSCHWNLYLSGFLIRLFLLIGLPLSLSIYIYIYIYIFISLFHTHIHLLCLSRTHTYTHFHFLSLFPWFHSFITSTFFIFPVHVLGCLFYFFHLLFLFWYVSLSKSTLSVVRTPQTDLSIIHSHNLSILFYLP